LLWIAAGVLAIGSKFLLRAGGKHVFNPACFAIVVLLLTSDHVWVSPGIWGSAMWLGFLLASCAGLVLGRAARVDIALAFFGAYGGLLVVRCLALGDPMTIPWHQVQSGSLLLFGFFMITDPRSTPDARIGRVIFAVTVALLAYYGQFVLQSRVSLFFSLMVAAPMVPLLDYIFQASRFQWTPMQDATQ
jgi:Na+-transporting NADH:ubiquinone oxidoreductase subunit NqrB